MGTHRRRAKIGPTLGMIMQFDFLEPLLSAEEAQRADHYTIRTFHLSGSELMERAGLKVAQEVEEILLGRPKPWSEIPVVVVCGPGNNGGDGWVVARRLWQNGIRTAILSFLEPDQLHGEAHIAAHQFIAAAENELWSLPSLDPCFQTIQTASHVSQILNQLSPLVVVDAIFGTGLKKAAGGLFAEVIDAINNYKRARSETHVLAIDIPSGLPSDGEMLSETHVRADSTLAIQFRKRTHLSGGGWLSCGKVKRVDIGISLESPAKVQGLLAQNQPPKVLLLPPKANQHKGHYGHVAVLYGSAGIEGASELSAYAALRGGAGLVTLLDGPKAKLKTFAEIMTQEITSQLTELERYSAFVVGPGVGESRLEQAREILMWAHRNNRPVVVDAGALPLLHKLSTDAPRSIMVATPHPGEAARLMHQSVIDVQADRIASAEKLLALSEMWSVDLTWVLKGTCPIVAHKSHGIVVVEGGVSTLAVGGSGDVLAGLCGALFKQTRSGFDCAILGTAVHLQSGRSLLTQHARGFLAREIADEIPKVIF